MQSFDGIFDVSLTNLLTNCSVASKMMHPNTDAISLLDINRQLQCLILFKLLSLYMSLCQIFMQLLIAYIYDVED